MAVEILGALSSVMSTRVRGTEVDGAGEGLVDHVTTVGSGESTMPFRSTCSSGLVHGLEVHGLGIGAQLAPPRIDRHRG